MALITVGEVQFLVTANTAGLRRAQNQLGSFNTNVGKAGRSVGKLNKVNKLASKSTNQFKDKMTELTKSVQIALGPLSGVAARITAFSGLVNQATFRVAGFIAAMIGFGVALGKAVKQANTFEVEMLRLEVRMQSMGKQFTLTTNELDQFAKKLGRDTLGSASDARRAMITLASATELTNEQFKRSTVLAQDLADSGFGAMEQQARRLAKILEDPKEGLTALRRVGVSFTEQQKTQIRVLAEFGDKSVAVEFILAKLEEKFGDVSKAAAESLPGVLDTLGERINEFLQETITSTKALDPFKDSIRNLTQIVEDFLTSSEVVSRVGMAFKITLTAIGKSAEFAANHIKDLLILIILLATTPLPKLIKQMFVLVTAFVPVVRLIAATVFAFVALKTAFDTINEALPDLTDKFSDFTNLLKDIFSLDIIKTFFNRLTEGLALAVDKIADFLESAARIIPAFKDTQKELLEAARIAREIGITLRNVGEDVGNKVVENLKTSGAALAGAGKDFVKNFDEAFGISAGRPAALIESILGNIIPTLKKLGKTSNDLFKKAFGSDIQSVIDNLKAKLDKFLSSASSGAKSAKKDLDALAKAMEEAVAVAEETRALVELLKSFESISKSAFDGIAKAFTSAVFEGKNALEELSSVARSVAADILQTFIKLAISNPIRNAIFGGIQGFQSAPAFGFLGDILGAIGGAFGGGVTGPTGGVIVPAPAILAHKGGIIENIKSVRSVSPVVFANAQHFARGGIAGDEIPAILHRGEEVLTRSDPRHADNLMVAGNSGVIINVINSVPGADVEVNDSGTLNGLQQIDIMVKSSLGRLDRSGDLEKVLLPFGGRRQAGIRR